jgi:hypothetical protein
MITKHAERPIIRVMKADANTLILLTLIDDLSSIADFILLNNPILYYKYLNIVKKQNKELISFVYLSIFLYICIKKKCLI